MSEKTLNNIRIINKHDTEENWLKATGFTPKQGEIIVYDIDDNYNYERIKIGDGVQNVNDLPFATNRSFIVTVSRDADENTIVDKTYKEIYDAAKAGMYVYMITGDTVYVDGNSMWPDTVLWLSYYSDYSVIFTHHDGSSEYEVEVDSDGGVSVYYSSSLPSKYSFGYEGMVLTVGENGEVNPADFPATIARTSDVEEVKELVGDTSVSEQINTAAVNNQSDWSVNDETDPAYVKNRTHWSKISQVELLSDCQAEASGMGFVLKNKISAVVGHTYIVNWNGTSYTCVAGFLEGLVYIGNAGQFGMNDTGEPFLIAFYPDHFVSTVGYYAEILPLDGSTSCTISIIEQIEDIHKIDNKYLSDEVVAKYDWNATESEYGHILNRTHYTEEVLEEIIQETTVTFGDATKPGYDTGTATGNATQIYPTNEIFVIEWNGVKYRSAVRSYTKLDGSFGRGIGNTGMFGGASYAEYPFLIGFLSEQEAATSGYTYFACVNDESTTATFSVGKVGEAVHRLDAKYLPEEVANKDYVDTAISTIPTPDVSGQIETHNTSKTAHNDIRTAINDVSALVGDKSVADQIDAAINSVAVTWDNVTNKPFNTSDINITWDGNTAGKTYVSNSGDLYYKVSDDIVRTCDFADGNASLMVTDAALNTPITEPIPLNNVTEEDGILVIGSYNIISVPRNNMILSINYNTVTFQKAGTYFRYIPDAFYISSLKITNTAGKIASSKLPHGVASKAEFDQHLRNSTWVQIYNSGSTTKNVNAFSGIDISGYTKIKVAIKCVNVAASAGTTAGAVIFTGEDGMDYSFSSLFGNLITNTAGTAGAMAEFTIVDGFIICDNALRSTSAANMLSNEYGQGAWGLTNVGGGLIACDAPLYEMKIAATNLSTTHYYGKGSKVIVWGCKE